MTLLINLFSLPDVITAMTWQEWVVALIVLLCIAEIGRRIVRFFRPTKKRGNPCANCTSECDLKRMFDEKQQECKATQKKNSKKCCG